MSAGGKVAIFAMVQSIGWTWFMTVTPPSTPSRCRLPSTEKPKNNASIKNSRGVNRLVKNASSSRPEAGGGTIRELRRLDFFGVGMQAALDRPLPGMLIPVIVIFLNSVAVHGFGLRHTGAHPDAVPDVGVFLSIRSRSSGLEPSNRSFPPENRRPPP